MLGENHYGKSGIRLVKVTRQAGRHDVKDVTVAVRFQGQFEAAHVSGDNTAILPTDTMKNTVYALAKDHLATDLESFGLHLSEHFLTNTPPVSRVRISLSEQTWERLTVRGRPHPHAFVRPGSERRVASVTRTREGVAIESGVEDLMILKSAQSGFAGFVKDKYTTLKETSDRILATVAKATWLYAGADVAFNEAWRSARQALVEAFAEHDSASVQHTLYAMGEAVLKSRSEIAEIRLLLPNKHHVLVDLSPFGLENRNEIFVATEEPYGLIEATVTRSS